MCLAWRLRKGLLGVVRFAKPWESPRRAWVTAVLPEAAGLLGLGSSARTRSRRVKCGACLTVCRRATGSWDDLFLGSQPRGRGAAPAPGWGAHRAGARPLAGPTHLPAAHGTSPGQRCASPANRDVLNVSYHAQHVKSTQKCWPKELSTQGQLECRAFRGSVPCRSRERKFLRGQL